MQVVDKATCDDGLVWYTIAFYNAKAEDTIAYRWLIHTIPEGVFEHRDSSIGQWYFLDISEPALVLLGVMYGEFLSDQTARH